MKTVNLVQGTLDWHEHRRKHFNASEAAAMLGFNPTTSRNDLLRMKATGNEKEFTAWVQKNVLDYGHEVEAMARPIVEKMIQEELYPVTGTEGSLSASFDGLTMMETIAFEHKQWNEALADLVRQNEVPDSHMPQLQQQLIVSGAEKVIFVVSDGTPEKMVWTTVYPNEEWFDELIQGWTQFRVDLNDYEHKEYKEKPVADPIQELPALFVELEGEVKSTNLSLVKDAATSFIENIKTDLETDEDFANAEEAAKFCDKAEKQLEATKGAALAQTQSIDEVMKTIDFVKDQLRSKRLMLNKLVKERKDQIKAQIVSESKGKFSEHIAMLNAKIAPCSIPATTPDFVGAMKNKRTIASLYNAVDTELANAKIEANKVFNLISDNLDHYMIEADGHEFLFNDLSQIINSPLEAFDAVIKTRIYDHSHQVAKKAEAERERIRVEEEAKARAKVAQANNTQQEVEQEPVKQAVKAQSQGVPVRGNDNPIQAWAKRHNVSEYAMKELYSILNSSSKGA
jgi:putative phage-type endonuclease